MHRLFRPYSVHGLVLAAIAGALATGTAHADDLKVQVKRGDLVVKGAAGGTASVTVVPTATGLRLEPQNETTINGSAEPFETDEVTRDWKIRLGKTRRIAFRTERPAEGIPALTPRKVVLTAGRRAEIDLIGVDVERDVKIDMGRALDGVCINVFESSVGGSLTAKMGVRDDALDVTIQSTTFGRSLKLFARAQNDSPGRAERFVITDCDIDGEFLLNAAVLSSEVEFKRNSIRTRASFKADMNLDMAEIKLGSHLTIKSNLHAQTIAMDHVSVAGKTTIATGVDDDTVAISDCVLGIIRARTGKGADVLETFDTVTDPRSAFDGSAGNDTWVTDGRADLRTISVERTDQQK